MQRLVHLVQKRLDALPMACALVLPDSQRVGSSNAPVTLKFKDWSAIAHLSAGLIGRVAQDYVQSRVQIEGHLRDLMALASHLASSNAVMGRAQHAVLPALPRLAQQWGALWQRSRSLLLHTPARDAAQIQFHYDVSDDFYALWLDPKRVYSCAYYRDDGMTLQAAQEAKLDHICRKLMLQPGERLLDVGAGWGALLLWAAQHYGVQATGITLSKNQHAYVNSLIEQKGLQGRVQMHLRDYRALDESQPFDKIASVGMFEHVGSAHMTDYFAKLARLLKPGGLVMNHGITSASPHNRQLGAGMGDFIERYIFPGGELLHASAVLAHMADGGLEMVDTENLRPHYARTLWAWSDALEAQLPSALDALRASAGDARADEVLRAYRLYLAGSAMCFEQGWISLHQMLATKADGAKPPHDQTVYPFARDYMYAVV
jgi:cyclopropane-fatty-acyl-phospholipid synthase